MLKPDASFISVFLELKQEGKKMLQAINFNNLP